ncbi:MAG: acetolactate synthase large subunit [Gammaproteobacteria bacterium]|nr:acetolactate synthase large subunit [Gammaproteobacteria bacterium]MDD9824855.1 acetolactate synthase large subunit [Gammaproteobacteria bacterium]MDD9863812.1 acetolactate synthase large subunit [Gammaproteobacteria bacterium]
MKGAELFVRCLENEEVECIFGIPGEENVDVMDALLGSSVRFVTTRHEQGAAFMADVYGRLTGKAGVCLATLGPGATNLVTGVADANMDRAPVVAIAGQGATTRLHKESHQILDLVGLFQPITKYSTQVRAGRIIPEIVRKSFKVAEAEKPGCSFIDFPENIAGDEANGGEPLKVQRALPPAPPESKIKQAAALIADARFPIVMAGNGVVRAKAAADLVSFAEKLNIPVATTFMAKGALPFSHDLSLGAVGLQASDYVSCGFNRADIVICVGYDIVEYHPHLWNKDKSCKIVHIDSMPAEVDEHYIVETGLVGDIGASLRALAELGSPRQECLASGLRETIVEENNRCAEDSGFPVKPQKIMWDLRQALAPEDIVISDVGAHKMWMARMYQAERPNTCIISNGFASMGIAVPGAFAAKQAFPERRVVAVTGDAGFLMNSQEIETALRHKIPFVILIWSDSEYGLIKWHQLRRFGRPSNISFNNPDFIQYARSFGAQGYRVTAAEELLPALRQALAEDTVTVVDCPVDYRENMKLTEKLGELVCLI